jgi:hypothetical protein
MLSTGDWDALDGHRIRRWKPRGGASYVDVHEAGGKRPIKAKISSWVGISAVGDSSHYRVSVEEKENCWWAPERNCWVNIYSDNGARDGFSFEAAMYSYEDAVEVAEMFIKWIQDHPAEYDTYVVRDYTDDDDESDDDWDDPEDNYDDEDSEW